MGCTNVETLVLGVAYCCYSVILSLCYSRISMARRISLLTTSNSNSQARELLRLYLAPTPGTEYPCSLSHLPHLQTPHPLTKQAASFCRLTHKGKYPCELGIHNKQQILVFILNKSYHKLRSFPNLKFNTLLPNSLTVDQRLLNPPSPLEVSNSPLARLAFQEESPINEKTVEFNTKLSQLLLQLKTELPPFFEKSHPYYLYASDLRFDFNYTPISFSVSSRLKYKLLVSSIQSLFRVVYSDLGLDILKITKSESDYSIHTRWRLTCVNRFSLSKKPVFFDAVSTFYMNEDGLIDRHTLDRVSKDTRKVPTLAWLFIGLGLYPSGLKEPSPAVEFAAKNKRLSRKRVSPIHVCEQMHSIGPVCYRFRTL